MSSGFYLPHIVMTIAATSLFAAAQE